MCRSRFTCTRQPDRYDVQPESQARVAIVTRQPDRYDVQPESQARVAIVTRQPDRYDVQPESQARVAIVTRQPDRYDVQPESQARVAIVTRQPDRYDVQPESQALLLCRRMHGSSRFATSPPYQRAPPIGQHPPTPRQSHPRLDWPSGVPGNARGADAQFWAGPPPVGRRQGRAGHREVR